MSFKTLFLSCACTFSWIFFLITSTYQPDQWLSDGFINNNVMYKACIVVFLETYVLHLLNLLYSLQYLLLFISYKFVKCFLAITFVLLVFSRWNFHDLCQRIFKNQEQNFSLIRRKTRNFPIDPHYKNRPLL